VPAPNSWLGGVIYVANAADEANPMSGLLKLIRRFSGYRLRRLQCGSVCCGLLLSICLFGQSAPTPIPAKTAQTKPVEPKLTPKEERGRRLLQSAEAEAAALQPDMRAFVLWKIADGYRKPDPAKADALLTNAFLASLSVEDIAPEGESRYCPQMQGCGIKIWLQRSILEAISSLPGIEKFLPQAQPEVRKDITPALVSRYIAKKDFAKAKQLITSLADQGQYPYSAAMDLMSALPSGSASSLEQVAIFNEALNAYQRQDEATSWGTTYDDLSGMVMRFWKDVPAAMAEDAIDQILAKAADLDKGPMKPHLTFSGPAGAVALNSQYQFRLFQLLPVLQELDKPKAEALLRDNPDLRPMLDRFPEGMQAVQPDVRMHPPKQDESPLFSMSISMADTPASVNTAAVEAQQEIQRKSKQITADADTNPRQAIAEAMSLPEYLPDISGGSSPRAEVLIRIASKVGKGNSTIAKDALGESRKSLSQVSLITQAKQLDDAAAQYVDIGAFDDADKTVKEALQVAEKLYAKDNDTDDPNVIFKGAWPSTNQWRRCVQTEARFSPSAAEEIIAGIRDADIATFEKIYFATSLLGVPSENLDVAVSSKNNNMSMSF
jgi:hypothetical protein